LYLFQSGIVELKLFSGDDGPEGIDDGDVEGSGKFNWLAQLLFKMLAKFGSLKKETW
jgi:hypothetical protein